MTENEQTQEQVQEQDAPTKDDSSTTDQFLETPTEDKPQEGDQFLDAPAEESEHEAYTLDAIEGFGEEALGKWTEKANELRLERESAGEVAKYIAEQRKEAGDQRIAELQAEFKAESDNYINVIREDETLGRDMKETQRLTSTVFGKYAPPALREKLKQANLQNEPDFIRMLYNIGKDTLEPAKPVGDAAAAAPAEKKKGWFTTM